MTSIYSVSQINSYIKGLFVRDSLLKRISIKGEISNCKYHSSGHIYFTLKDRLAVISAVMFQSKAKDLSFQLKDGQEVVISGSVEVYERDGKYQIYVNKIVLDGTGRLYENYEKLKQELNLLGWFDASTKKSIPEYSNKIGVVTANTGAAIRDIIDVCKRRNPYVDIILYPAIVQGDNAVNSIVNGIRALDKMEVDLIIVGRGGGSIEDLWAFNSKEVAEAIYYCRTPIISAVGHETDTTIADFVADLRAPTPSAAAELATYIHDELIDRINRYEVQLVRLVNNRINNYVNKADSYNLRLKLLGPLEQLKSNQFSLIKYEDDINNIMNSILTENRHKISIYAQQLNGLSPALKLYKGYSYVADSNGYAIRSIDQVKHGDIVNINVTDGIIEAGVLDVRK